MRIVYRRSVIMALTAFLIVTQSGDDCRKDEDVQIPISRVQVDTDDPVPTPAVGAVIEIRAMGFADDGRSVDFAKYDWIVSDPSIVEIVDPFTNLRESRQRIRALRTGQVTITARTTIGGRAPSSIPPGYLETTPVNGVRVITVVAAPVAITTAASLPAGSVGQSYSQVLTATGGDGRDVLWSSTGVVPPGLTLAPSGILSGTPQSAGSFTMNVTATSGNQSATRTFTLTINGPAVTGLTVSSGGVLIPTETRTLALTDQNGSVVQNSAATWTSSNQAVATVSSAGVVTGVAAGTATITAVLGPASGNTSVTVVPPTASVTLSPRFTFVNVDETASLTAVARDAQGNATIRTINFSSNATGVATVTSTGIVTGRGQGGAIVTATADGQTARGYITVGALGAAEVNTCHFVTGAFLGGVTVEIRSGATVIATAVSTSDGVARFAGLPPGEYTAFATTAGGFTPRESFPVTVTARQLAQSVVLVTPPPQ